MARKKKHRSLIGLPQEVKDQILDYACPPRKLSLRWGYPSPNHPNGKVKIQDHTDYGILLIHRDFSTTLPIYDRVAIELTVLNTASERSCDAFRIVTRDNSYDSFRERVSSVTLTGPRADWRHLYGFIYHLSLPGEWKNLQSITINHTKERLAYVPRLRGIEQKTRAYQDTKTHQHFISDEAMAAAAKPLAMRWLVGVIEAAGRRTPIPLYLESVFVWTRPDSSWVGLAWVSQNQSP